MTLTLSCEITAFDLPRCWAEIDLSAIRHNVTTLRRLIAPSNFVAVVKANAYGLGAIPIARAAIEAGVSGLAVSSCEEGDELRQAGLTGPILVLGYVPVELAPVVVRADLTLTVNTPQLAVALSQAVERSGRCDRLPVHLKLDTGLHRYGLTPTESLALARLIATLPGLTLQGLYTHFASGDEADGEFVHEQQRRFDGTRRQLAAAGFAFPQIHLANSASGIVFPDVRRSFVRFGLAMYGYYGSPSVEETLSRDGLFLRPCLTLKSLAVRLSDLPAGETVGYNRTFRADQLRRLALVPFGYADGYRRALGNRGSILINGQRAAVVGRVSMDQITADITGLEGIREADEVVLVGRQGEATITLEEVAALCDTIPYEIMTGLGPRVKRVYLD